MEDRSPSSLQVCCCRTSRSHHYPRISLWRTFLSATCLLLLAHSTSQAEYTFTSEPMSYYYIITGQSLVIPCAVEVTRDDGSVDPVSPTLLINSEPLDIHDIDQNTHIFAVLTRNVVVGVLILDSRESDDMTVVECTVKEGNETVVSMATMIYVGDGRPLAPLSHPVQTADTVHSITVDWGEAPTPTSAPISHYTISLVEQSDGEREILFDAFSNNTVAIVTGLVAGTTYNISVFGVNRFGEGQRSNYETGMTTSPVVPLPPTEVMVHVRDRGGVCDVILSWVPAPLEPDVMTPVTNFIIYYGRDEGNLMNYTTVDGLVTRYNMSGWTEKGEWLVGVASVNSAGMSSAVYKTITIEPPTAITPSQDTTSTPSQGTTPSQDTTTTLTESITNPTPTNPLNLTTIVAVTGSCFVILVVILIILIIICMVKHRIKTLNGEHSFDIREHPTPIDELDGSPSAKRKKTPSPKHLRESDSSELRNYGSEPRRLGSRTPPPVDFV